MNVQDYAPENSKQLSPEQLAAMEFFTVVDLKALAKEYPNKSNQRPYLILKDKSKKEQIYPASTWANLLSLHTMGLKHFVALSYRDIFYKGKTPDVKTAPLQDLTRDEVLKGLKVKEVSVQPPAPVEMVTNEPGDQFSTKEDEDFEDLKNEAAKKTEKGKSVPVKETKKSTKGKK